MFLTILAQVSPSPTTTPSTGGNALLSLLPLIVIFGLFYAFMIRPQRQRQRRQQALLQELNVGDEVQTADHGRVSFIICQLVTVSSQDKVQPQRET